ncbi:MAG: serine hydrolase domain-containing protein [Steroidobacteraceae bacterium]
MKRAAITLLCALLACLLIAVGPGTGRSRLYWQALLHGAGSIDAGNATRTISIDEPAQPSLPPLDPAAAGINPLVIEDVMSLADSQNATAVVIVRDGHLVAERYFRGTDASTSFAADRFAALLATLAVGAAFDMARFGSEAEPIGNYLPSWRGDARGAVTIADLLAGRGRFVPLGAARWPGSPAVTSRTAADFEAFWLARPLGEIAEYANETDIELLALALRNATATSYPQFLQQTIWRPLGGGRLTFLADGGGQVRAACCLQMRQGDIVRLAALLMGDGVYMGEQILRPGWIRHMWPRHEPDHRPGMQLNAATPHPRIDPDSGEMTDAPWREPFLVDDVVFAAARERQRIWLVPSLQLAVIRLGKAPPAGADWQESALVNALIRGISKRSATTRAPDAMDPSQFAPH